MDFYSLMAECAITLVGFSAIYSILQGSTGPRGHFRAIGTLIVAAIGFLVSIFPLLLDQLKLSPTALWTTCSMLAALFTISAFVIILPLHRQLSARGFPPQTNKLLAIGFLLVGGAAILFTVNIYPWPELTRHLIYRLGIVFLMLMPIWTMASGFVLALQESMADGRPTEGLEP
jgi:small-conductance mechanosensitive channel